MARRGARHEPAAIVLTAEEIAEAKQMTAASLIIFAALVGGFCWLEKIERDREQKRLGVGRGAGALIAVFVMKICRRIFVQTI